MLANEYDFNLYGSDKHVMRLSAYKIMIDFDGNISTNYDSEWFTLVLTRDDDEQAIKQLVNNEVFYDEHLVEDYTDFDEWFETEELLSRDFSPRLREWLDSLPDYEMLDLTQGEK